MSKDYRDYLINADTVREMVTNYEKKNYSEINSKRPASKPDSKEYWYPIEVLLEYLQFVKETAEKQGLKEVGIKIKLAQYPEDKIVGPLQKENTKGYQTICLVPTEGASTAGKPESKTISAMNFGTIAPPNV